MVPLVELAVPHKFASHDNIGLMAQLGCWVQLDAVSSAMGYAIGVVDLASSDVLLLFVVADSILFFIAALLLLQLLTLLYLTLSHLTLMHQRHR